MILDMIPTAKAGHPGVDRWNNLINTIAPRFKVPPNLLKATILYESGGDPVIVSFDQGCGLCQITSGVEKNGTSFLYQGQNILNPSYNIEVACRYFIAPNIKSFPGNIDAIIAAYNAGAGAVERALREGRDPSTTTYGSWYVERVRTAYGWFCAQSHKEHS